MDSEPDDGSKRLQALEAEAAALTPLSPQDQITVIEAWNKSLAWKDQVLEAIYYRWMVVHPPAKQMVGFFFETLKEDFFSTFDIAVRQLRPETETIQRESYRSVHPRVGIDGQEVTALSSYVTFFAHIGLDGDCWVHLRDAFMFGMSTYAFYLEEPEKEDLEKQESGEKEESALWRWFTIHVMGPAVKAIQDFLTLQKSELVVKKIPAYWHSIVTSQEVRDQVGQIFYMTLMADYPQMLDYFKSADMDALASHLAGALGLIVKVAESGQGLKTVYPLLNHLAEVHMKSLIPTWSYELVGATVFKTLEGAKSLTPELVEGWGFLYDLLAKIIKQPMLVQERLLKEAEDWFRLLQREWGWTDAQYAKRMTQVAVEVGNSGSYTHTSEELQYGCQVAWRNSAKCIGRINWNTLMVRDKRHVDDPDSMFEECVEHLRIATAGENFQSVMTMFAPRRLNEMWGFCRFANIQFTAYACYKMPNGSLMGDPGNEELTRWIIEECGWKPPKPRSPWDVLPLVMERPNRKPRLFEWPKHCLFQIPIEHPSGNKKFKALGLRWSAVPTICAFNVRIGGVDYPCNAFNGWFVEKEIARDLWERYDKGKEIAECFGMDTAQPVSMWKEKSYSELNAAVVHSFRKAKSTVVDHYTVSDQFLVHCQREKKAGREVPAQWSWIGGWAGIECPVWHKEMRDFALFPQYHYQCQLRDVHQNISSPKAEPEPSEAGSVVSSGAKKGTSCKLAILFGSETGTCERYARGLAKKLRAIKPKVAALNEYAEKEQKADLTRFTHLLVITSTFGAGGPPFNGSKFLVKGAEDGGLPRLPNSHFCVLGLGSSSYPNFCAFASKVDTAFGKTGARRMMNLMKADETKGQEDTYKSWMDLVLKQLPVDLAALAAAGTQGKRIQTRIECEVVPPANGAAAASTTFKLPAKLSNMVACPVVSSKELFDHADALTSCHQIAFDISSLEERYTTGDHLSVMPVNSIEDVERIATAVGVKVTDVVQGWEVETTDGAETDRFPAFACVKYPTSVLEALSIGVSCRLDAEILQGVIGLLWKKLPQESGDSGLGAELRNLAIGLQVPGTEALAPAGGQSSGLAATKEGVVDRLVDAHFTVGNLLHHFLPLSKLNFAELLQVLPAVKPRYYSISSSSKKYPTHVYLTVGLVAFKSQNGTSRTGLCSSMLNNLRAGDRALVSVHSSTFRLPEDPAAPILMIGAGTGIAPMAAFAEEREHLLDTGVMSARSANGSKVFGRGIMYTGFRSDGVSLYKERIKTWLEKGALTEAKVALSRDPSAPKAHVQDLMNADGMYIAKLLDDPHCSYYVCGDAKVADSVYNAMIQALCVHGGKSRVTAAGVIKQMMAENRYNLDVWGVVSHTLEVGEKPAPIGRQMMASGAKEWVQQVEQIKAAQRAVQPPGVELEERGPADAMFRNDSRNIPPCSDKCSIL